MQGVRLLLIDGPNVIRRIHAAIPVNDTSKLIEQSISSSLQSIKRALKQHTPTHVLCAFESDGPTWRHQQYPDYKKDRPPMPEELVEIFSRLKIEINTLGVYTLSIAEMEADDVIASVAVKASAQGGDVTILSTDTGQAQLLRPGIKQFDHFKQAEISAETIWQRYAIKTEQLNDYFAMVGDKSHSLPGITGIGAKTAARLLNSYTDLEEIILDAVNIGGRTGDSILKQGDLAKDIKQLLVLRTDLNLGFTFRDLRYHPN